MQPFWILFPHPWYGNNKPHNPTKLFIYLTFAVKLVVEFLTPQRSLWKHELPVCYILWRWKGTAFVRLQNLSTSFWDIPGGVVVKNPPANAGDKGLSPAPGRSHMLWSNKARATQLLSLRSRAREPQLLSLRATTIEARAPRACALQQEKPPQWETHAPQQRVAPARRN